MKMHIYCYNSKGYKSVFLVKTNIHKHIQFVKIIFSFCTIDSWVIISERTIHAQLLFQQKIKVEVFSFVYHEDRDELLRAEKYY